jgi:hypothetical protein
VDNSNNWLIRLKEKILTGLKRCLSFTSGSRQTTDDIINYYESLGLKKIMEEVHDDSYYQKQLNITRMPTEKTLDNIQAREWYLYYLAKIPEAIDKSLPLEAQALQAYQLRKWIRKKTRDLMAERELAHQLELNHPNLTWSQMKERQISKGLLDEELIAERIISRAAGSNKAVNELLGVKLIEKEIDPLWSRLIKTPTRIDQEFEEKILNNDKIHLNEFLKKAKENNLEDNKNRYKVNLKKQKSEKNVQKVPFSISRNI